MKFNLNSFLIGVSVALDMAEKNIFNVSTYHSRRVAYIAVRIAKKLGMSKEECFDICSLAILHDNGLTESALIYDRDPVSSMIDLEHVFEHCQIGENNVKNYPFLTSVANVILYHHENYDGTGFYGKVGTDIPIMSRIISFSDVIDCNVSLIDSSLSKKNKIISN
ncbi:MAG: phosphohydrolase, partial [Sulfuricurvum sp. PD_MW2]|uniref:HD-GYP domain-containing protein n=1 Tax=Sulfuricurvum sp. PD_MW2 TaxID=2027917 RepID=UPI000C05E0E8